MEALFGSADLVSWRDLAVLGTRLGIDLVFASIVIFGVYQRLYRGREFTFTYLVFNVITFSMCLVLRKVPMSLGFGLGLFAVFGVLRYRTEEIRTRDLTYLFIVIGLGILNGVAGETISVAETVAVNLVITALTVAELRRSNRPLAVAPMLYDNLALLRPGQRDALHADIKARTGLDVVSVRVDRIDLLRDAAELTLEYREVSTPPRPTLQSLPRPSQATASGRTAPLPRPAGAA